MLKLYPVGITKGTIQRERRTPLRSTANGRAASEEGVANLIAAEFPTAAANAPMGIRKIEKDWNQNEKADGSRRGIQDLLETGRSVTLSQPL